MDGLSLGLGAASLAIQIFDGILTGYEYFEVAARMPEDCASLGLRMQIEHSRLLDWGEVSGLTDPQHHSRYDVRLKAQRPLILAMLSEMRALFERLTAIKSSYEQSDWNDFKARSDGVHGLTRQSSPSVTSEKASEPATTAREGDDDGAGIDTSAYSDIFKSANVPLPKRKYAKGFNHVVKIAKSSKYVATHPKSLRWAARDKELFEKTVSRLRELTDFLHETLGDDKLELLIDMTQETCFAMVQLTTSVTQRLDLLAAAQDTKAGNGLFERLTRFRIIHDDVYSTEIAEGLITPTLTRQAVDLDPSDSMGIRTGARYQEEHVWVEWKKYRKVYIGFDGPDAIEGAAHVTAKQVHQLASLLQKEEAPPEFRIPHCLGYFEDANNTRFGFVYEERNGTRKQTGAPASLDELTSLGQASVSARVKVARMVASALLCLHVVGWIHKDIRAKNVLMPGDASFPDLADPSLSGFEFSRPDVNDSTNTKPPETEEWAVYCHPDYQGAGRNRGFRKHYDIYSLGIVLIELAYWRPAKAIFASDYGPSARPRSSSRAPVLPSNTGSSVGGDGDASQASAGASLMPDNGVNGATTRPTPSQYTNIRDRLLQEQPQILENIRMQMGDHYHSAVKACIIGLEAFGIPKSADVTQPVVGALLQQAYSRLVVDVLAGISV